MRPGRNYVDIKRAFLYVGALVITLVAALSLGAVYWIEKQAKDFNRKRTEKARHTKLENIENHKALDAEEREILEANEREKEKENPGSQVG